MNDGVTSKSILLLAANPKGTVSLRLQEEEREIKERLRLAGHGKVPINLTGATRTRDIQQAMLDFKAKIVHFTGHDTGKDGLAFEDVAGNLKLIDSDALANLFRLFPNYVECVVLNACYSEFQAEAIAQHIDYVIGMNQAIGDRAAIEFSVGFYTALGAGESVEFAYDLGCNAIQLEGIPEHLTPVLFVKKNELENAERQSLAEDIYSSEQATEQFPTTTGLLAAEEFYIQGKEKYEVGDYQGAISDYQEAISLQPDNPEIYVDREKAKDRLENCRDFRGALLDFEQALRLASNNVCAYERRGQLKLDLKNFQGAVSDFSEAISLQPNNVYAHCMRVVEKERLNDEQGAITDFNKAISLQPTYIYAYFKRGMTKFRRDAQGVIVDFSEVIRLEPNFAPAYEFRGMLKNSCFLEKQDKKGAAADYRKAASIYKQEKDVEKFSSMIEKIEAIEKYEKDNFWRWLLP